MRFYNFNPRSYKRSDLSLFRLLTGGGYLNPRSYKRSDEFNSVKRREQTISIHAPTRGATAAMGNMRHVIMISIHAPTRGATRRMEEYAEGNIISIHAPTRGATAKMHNIPYTYL